MPNHYVELIDGDRVTGHLVTRGHVTLAIMHGRQENRNQVLGLNVQLTEAVCDLETTFSEHRTNVNARFNQLTTVANNCMNLLEENQAEKDNANKRGVKKVVHMLFFICVISFTMLCNFGWVHYREAVNAQERAEAMAEQARVETAKVAYLKELWLVKAYFQRDWVMTVSWAEYYRFTARWFS